MFVHLFVVHSNVFSSNFLFKLESLNDSSLNSFFRSESSLAMVCVLMLLVHWLLISLLIVGVGASVTFHPLIQK
jgi:hypothetical protein